MRTNMRMDKCNVHVYLDMFGMHLYFGCPSEWVGQKNVCAFLVYICILLVAGPAAS